MSKLSGSRPDVLHATESKSGGLQREDTLYFKELQNMPLSDSPREACGVFGISAPGMDIARLTYFAIYALQHRGQEAAGIATCDGKTAHIHKGLGLVSQVFNEDNLHHLQGHLGIGHTRYSTTGSPRLNNTQPYILETLDGPLAIGHNGNLVNAPNFAANYWSGAWACPLRPTAN